MKNSPIGKIQGMIWSAFILCAANALLVWETVPLSGAAKAAITAFSVLVTLVFMFKDHGCKSETPKLKRLSSGAFVLGCGIFCSIAGIAVMIFAFPKNGWLRNIFGTLLAELVITVVCLSGIVRVASSARQIKVLRFIALFFLWYIPAANVFVFISFYRSAVREYRFEEAKAELDSARKENEVCKTKYPILMVHGIFFRDWQLVNYWGRIPAELIRNGAVIYYGGQQSANKIEISAAELAERIKQVLAETGAEKVNIIAHSKGGLDSRCAISKLGMSQYVATLTTINTPHLGCEFVDKLLAKIPESVQGFVDRKYNKLFKKLGDSSPSFLNGVRDLTAASCSRFNEETPEMPGVRYRSVMSAMNSARSAAFPLNIGFLLNKPYDKHNDGLVTKKSGMYFPDSVYIEHKGRRGISHGDIIDLMRENIKDFDVREFYVDLVKELKEQGY
ncbi:MAG: triacylglycerol lipase [Ruminococcus sp.]|nr:triacylglycerol lipase [Ruminococcus sp.]